MQEIRHIPLIVGGRDIMADIANTPEGMMVAIRGICEAIGVAAHRQQERIQSDPRFNWQHMLSVAEDGKTREMLCLPVEQVVPWLFTINSNKVTKPEVKATLLSFQKHLGKELYAVATGRIGSERTAILEKQMGEVLQQIKEMRDENAYLREKVALQEDTLKYFFESDKYSASAAGYMMNAVKVRKKASEQLA